MMTDIQQAFLNCYLSTLNDTERATIPQINAEHFCADEWNANTCASLINTGIKTASCSLRAGYAIEQEPEPVVGQGESMSVYFSLAAVIPATMTCSR